MDMTPKVRHILDFIDSWAPSSTKMDFDNVGLLVGHPENAVSRILTCLDVTPSVVDEAAQNQYDLIVAHHPLIFKKMDRIQPTDEQGRMIYKLIRNDISVIASHTNLDAAYNGVSFEMARQLGLNNVSFLKSNYPLERKVECYADQTSAQTIAAELKKAGARGVWGDDTGAMGDNSSSTVRIQCYIEEYSLGSLYQILGRYDIPAHQVHILSTNTPSANVGMGAIGELPGNGLKTQEFLAKLGNVFGTSAIKYSGEASRISKVAVCGGAGVFLTSAAIKNEAQAFVTSDIKYHDFFVEQAEFLLIDIGHYESEWPIVPYLADQLTRNFENLEVQSTNVTTNPVKTFNHQ